MKIGIVYSQFGKRIASKKIKNGKYIECTISPMISLVKYS